MLGGWRKVLVLLALGAWSEVRGRGNVCAMKTNGSTVRKPGMYTDLPKHIQPISTCDYENPQSADGMKLHVFVGHDNSGNTGRGMLCTGLRSALYHNVRVQVHDVRLGKWNKRSGWTAACDERKKGHHYHTTLICKTWGWLGLANNIKDDKSYILIHDSDFTYGGGVAEILRAYKSVGADVIMGTEATCSLPIFKMMKWGGLSQKMGACNSFWKFQMQKGDPGSAFINSGMVMGRADLLKTWLQLVVNMSATSTNKGHLGDQSFFALALAHQRAGKPGETWRIKNGPVKGFTAHVLPFNVSIDFRKLAFMTGDSRTRRGWDLTLNRTEFGKGHPYTITPDRARIKKNWRENDGAAPVTLLHWAGPTAKFKMLCGEQEKERLPHSGACMPADFPICFNGKVDKLSALCPSPWTRGCQREIDQKYVGFDLKPAMPGGKTAPT